MKDLGILVWFMQLGISVAVPLAGSVLLAVWLHNSQGWGEWVIWVGVAFGVYCAIGGLKDALQAMDKYVKRNKPEDAPPPPVSFNDHD